MSSRTNSFGSTGSMEECIPFDSTWEDTPTLGSRKQFAHQNGRHQKKHFDVNSIFGIYSIKCAAANKLNGDNTLDLTIELHESVDYDDVHGVRGTFNWGKLQGIILMAGSRRGLRDLMEREESDGVDETTADGGSDEDNLNVFEKNTFRTPKFFFAWRGRVDKSVAQGGIMDADKENLGFIQFSGNACKELSGTITSKYWGKNAKFTGRQLKNKATSCPHTWNDFAGAGSQE